MQDRNVIGGVTAVFISPLIDFYQSLAPFLILALMLIFIDSVFGIKASKKRGDVIRSSRMWRRAINKLVDYICWVTLSGMIGQTFGLQFHIPLLPVFMLCVVYSIELTSIFDNYFEYKGIKKKFNVTKFFAKLLNRPEIEDCIEDVESKDTHK